MSIRTLILCVVVGMIFQANAATIKVACIGDSITFGANSSDPATKSYPADLTGLLGAGYQIMNYGVSGTTMLGIGAGDFPYISTQQYKDAYTFKPAIIVLMLGSNDSKSQNWANKAQFESDTRAMIAHYLTISPPPQIYLCLPCPVYGAGAFGITNPIVHDEVIPILRAVAASTGTPLIDVNGAMSNHPELFADLVHPNDAGYVLLAQTVKSAITLAAPTALSATVQSASRVDLTWTDNATTETGFSVERKSLGGTYSKIATSAANTLIFSDTTTAPLTQYTYRVRAINAAGESPFTNEITVITPDLLPIAPTSLVTVTTSVSQVDLTWVDASSSEDGFQIERKGGTTDFVAVGTTSANATTFSDKGLSTATQYTYRVRAINSVGASDPSNESSTTTFSGAAAPTATDSDGDGFPDALETAVGSSPSNPLDTPMAGALAGTPQALADAKLNIKLNFAKGGRDSIALSGAWILPAGFSSAGQTIVVDIGGVAETFALGAHGTAKSGDANVAVKDSGKSARIAKFSVKFAKGDFATAFVDEGLANQTVSAQVTVRVSILFASTFYQTDIVIGYKAKAGKSGAAK